MPQASRSSTRLYEHAVAFKAYHVPYPSEYIKHPSEYIEHMVIEVATVIVLSGLALTACADIRVPFLGKSK